MGSRRTAAALAVALLLTGTAGCNSAPTTETEAFLEWARGSAVDLGPIDALPNTDGRQAFLGSPDEADTPTS